MKPMKTTNLKYIVYALAALMLMQSCVAYHKAPVTVDEAVATNNKVKVYSIENKKYTFNKLVKEEDKIYGISSLNTEKEQEQQIPNSYSFSIMMSEISETINRLERDNNKLIKTDN